MNSLDKAIMLSSAKNSDIEGSSFSDIVKKAKEMLMNQLKSKDSGENLRKLCNEVYEFAQHFTTSKNKNDIDSYFSAIKREAVGQLNSEEFKLLERSIESVKKQLKELDKY